MEKSKKRPVEVVVCGDPWANKPPPAKRQNSDGKGKGGKGGGKGGRETFPGKKEEFNLKLAFKDVVDLGATQFEAWQRCVDIFSHLYTGEPTQHTQCETFNIILRTWIYIYIYAPSLFMIALQKTV